MSLLNEFFVAEPAEITVDVIRRGTAGRRPAVLASSFTHLTMALLLVAIEGRPEDEAVDRLDAFDVVGEPDGPWVIRLPDALRDALAGATAGDLRRYAERWVRAEELAGATAEDMAALLESLAPLARTGRGAGSSLYLWVCL
jgi:hypothetical protein